MKQSPTSDWSDEKIVECIHYWSAQSSKCGFDSDKYNKINFEYLVPCADMLKIRGPASLAKLLPLLDDENSEVRLATASIAYEVDKTACRKVLLGCRIQSRTAGPVNTGVPFELLAAEPDP